MFKRVLVALDGSETSTAALTRAMAIVKAFSADLIVVTAYDSTPIIGAGLDYGYMQTQYVEAGKTQAEKIIKDARELVENSGLKADTRIIESHRTWSGIIDTATASKVDLIVMGSHGLSGLEKLITGSVTQRVLQHTTLPVMVVRN
jgi:nucleotide-binding universal stress UspA family protein